MCDTLHLMAMYRCSRFTALILAIQLILSIEANEGMIDGIDGMDGIDGIYGIVICLKS